MQRNAIPPSWRQKSLVNKKGGCVAIKTQQDNSLCLAVKPPPFDKGGKFSARRGIVRNQQSVYLKARCWRFSRDSAVLEGLNGESGIA